MDFRSLMRSYNLDEVDKKLGERFWHPVEVAHLNNWVLKATAIKGEFPWQSNEDDELFWVYKGEMLLETESSMLSLKEGEGTVIPKGIRHKQRASDRAVVLHLEPA
ncbi:MULTISPECIES: hypothetical protein [Parachlamydia]|uniref:Cupin 2 conserved barrel domain-containing protein n=2 Tax=Parachlamydia acanthamoebae TaxID=83552 RepID=F8L1L0_PARAV|nr:hypothetical protein [Parachlamydia acanthamoebae]EFB41435.1 hypothetical protein pah_c039o007 [Parachlamydia acanthamoebae str. Hall's coccus]KIA77112.1 hypothetical protein DB43_GU00050 [Parachlamydia acanthamoebae]CCB87152.1 putative uncharacterized protein [Parachlamydia acanthamoebae UV-7]